MPHARIWWPISNLWLGAAPHLTLSSRMASLEGQNISDKRTRGMQRRSPCIHKFLQGWIWCWAVRYSELVGPVSSCETEISFVIAGNWSFLLLMITLSCKAVRLLYQLLIYCLLALRYCLRWQIHRHILYTSWCWICLAHPYTHCFNETNKSLLYSMPACNNSGCNGFQMKLCEAGLGRVSILAEDSYFKLTTKTIFANLYRQCMLQREDTDNLYNVVKWMCPNN